MTPEAKEDLYKKVQGITDDLKSAGIRVETDYREGYSPGWKFNDWELKGIPLRIEFGKSQQTSITASVLTMAFRSQGCGKRPSHYIST
jgi:prolyl-tRNA synthetase